MNNLPAGKYIVSAEIQYDAAAGDNENGIYAATAADEVHGGTKAGATGFVAYSTPEILVTDGTLRIGIKTFATQSQSWTAARNFKLTMVGEVSLDEFEKKLTDLLATAKTDAKEPMNATQAEALDKVIKDYDGKKLTSISEYETALAAANKAVSEAETSIANYKEALDLLKVGETFDEKGKDIFYTTSSISELLYAVNERLFVSLASYNVDLIKFEIGEAAKMQGVGADMTAAMPARWTGATANYAGRQERYYDAAAGSPVDADVMTQTISGLKPGEYEVTFEAAVNYTDGRGIDGHAASKEDNVTVVFAQDVKESVEVVSQTACTVFPQYTLRAFVGDDGKLTYGIHNNDKGANWFVAAAVKLVYLNANKPTAVNSVKAEMQRVGAVKVVRNGVIYILTGGKEINASGARMK